MTTDSPTLDAVDSRLWRLGSRELVRASAGSKTADVVAYTATIAELRALADACMEAAAYLEAQAEL